MDDIGPLVELAAAHDSDVHLFDIRTATDWSRWSKGSNTGQSVFLGENPESGAYINYFLANDPGSVIVDGASSENGSGPDAQEAPSQARAEATQVTIRITSADGELVREFRHQGEKGVNRAVWNLSWEGAERIEGSGGGGGFFFGGGGGPPASPGTYTATLVVGDQELSKDFELRGDPNVQASQADYEARLAAALEARDLESRINNMVNTLIDLDEQVEGLLSSIGGKGLANESAIRSKAGEAQQQIDDLENELRRPLPRMGYRQWPRLAEQISRLARSMNSAQARPTDGQLEVLGEIEVQAEQRANELTTLINTTIVELNELLGDAPKIMSEWRRAQRIS